MSWWASIHSMQKSCMRTAAFNPPKKTISWPFCHVFLPAGKPMDASLSLSVLFAPPNKPPSRAGKEATVHCTDNAHTAADGALPRDQGPANGGADDSGTQQRWQQQQWQQVGAILGAPDGAMLSILEPQGGLGGGSSLGAGNALAADPSASAAGNQMDRNLLRPAGWEDPFCWDAFEFARVRLRNSYFLHFYFLDCLKTNACDFTSLEPDGT